MNKYRKKPVVIEAVQFTGANHAEVFDFCPSATNSGCSHPNQVTNRLRIPTLEGDMEVRPDDWVIKGVKGEFYPCKPDIFEATYEPL